MHTTVYICICWGSTFQSSENLWTFVSQKPLQRHIWASKLFVIQMKVALCNLSHLEWMSKQHDVGNLFKTSRAGVVF